MPAPIYYSASWGPFATTPKPVSSYEELKAFNTDYEDAIIVAVDFEAADHYWRDAEQSKRYLWSELGVALFDPRVARYGENTFDQLAQKIEATHWIRKKWSLWDEDTCTCIHSNRRHVARPYHSQFAKSTIMENRDVEFWLVDFITSLARHNLTEEELKNGESRKIKILYWDQRLEKDILDRCGINLNKLPGCPNVESWDFQIWLPFEKRFFPETRYDDDGWPLPTPRVGCGRAMASLGILGGDEQAIREGREHGIVFHNAANDTVAQILCWLRFATMTEEEWNAWVEQRESLPPIDLSWVDPEVYQENYEERPKNKPPPTPPPSPEPIRPRRYPEVWGPGAKEDDPFADLRNIDPNDPGLLPDPMLNASSSWCNEVRTVLTEWKGAFRRGAQRVVSPIREQIGEWRDRVKEWKESRRRPRDIYL